MNLAEEGQTPVSERSPEPRSPAKAKLALLPMKEAIATLEEHCAQFSGHFDSRGRVKCARLAKGLARTGALAVSAVLTALGSGEVTNFGPSEDVRRGKRISPEGVALILGALKQAITAIEDHCDKQPGGEFDCHGAAECGDLARTFGTAIADAFGEIIVGLGMRGKFTFRAQAQTRSAA